MWSEMHVTVKMVGDACRWAHLFQEALGSVLENIFYPLVKCLGMMLHSVPGMA